MIVEPGCEWIVDAYGCDPSALRCLDTLQSLCDGLIADLQLQPVAAPVWHQFPDPAGITGVVVLSESHLAVHTFPERGFAALNLYCCRPRPTWAWEERLRERLGSTDVRVTTHLRGISST